MVFGTNTNKKTLLKRGFFNIYIFMIDTPIILLTIALFATVGFILFREFTRKTPQDGTPIAPITQTPDEIRQEKERLAAEYKQKVTEKITEIREEYTQRNELQLEKLKLQAQADIQKEEEKMRQRVLELQENIDKKESRLEVEREKIERVKEELREIKQNLLDKKEEITAKETRLAEEYDAKISQIAGLTKAEAAKTILDVAKTEMGGELLQWQQKYLESAEDDANEKAREIVALAVQRCSSEVANELTVTTIKLNDDNDKGKLIGKQGRNIQWIEKTLGVELIIDDTPEVITISGFSSVRRNIAKKTVEKLLADGRIHPASIEEMYQKSRSEIAQEIADSGQWAVNELGIYDFPAKLVRLIGRLKFRTSYGQNMIKHSVEMAKLAKLLAEEMNERFPHRKPIDVDICVKGALLHDIGKAIDEETTPKGNHITLGEKVCETFGLDWRIRKCVSSHHDESYYDAEHGFCIEAALVDACDNISGGRPGARKESTEAYYQRVEAMEKIAEQTPGVNKAWIMRGSRELWVFFDTERITPAQMHTTTREIANRIQTDVKYPGEIKIVGMWEDKIVEYAR